VASSISVTRLGHGDLATVAAIHERAWDDSAITAFGRPIIERYYRWLLDGPHDALLMGAWLDGRLVGFCAAGVFRGAMNGFLRANRRRLAWHLATHPSLLLRGRVRERLREALAITARFSRIARPPQAATPRAPRFSVLAIATDPTVRGAGAGRALMIEAEQRARREGHARMSLSVHVDNARGVKFYEDLGWLRDLSSGVWTGAMSKPLAR
jgi:GNAT superfamily N-acetyltransferase